MATAGEELRVERDGVMLAGSLWEPAGTPRSLIVMHPGSGPSDRHNDVLFPPLRAALLAAGHAVASFDKRGVGGSTGSLQTTSIEQQAGDLLGCATYLRARRPDVPIGGFGHSQGGWVVFEALGTGDSLDFGIANSGPAVSPAAQERHALAHATEGNEDQAAALALFDELVACARRDDALDEVRRRVDLTDAGSLRGFAADLLDSDEGWQLTSLLFRYDPSVALAAVRAPLLAIYGAADPIVPVDVSVEVLRRTVDPDLLHVRVFDGGGHRLEPASGEGFVDGYLTAIVDFADACAS